jgi:apolipoprotein N-acyltransferase
MNTYRSKPSIVVLPETAVTAVAEVYPSQEQGQEEKQNIASFEQFHHRLFYGGTVGLKR